MTAFMKLMGKNFSPSIISSRKKKTKNKVRKEIETTKKKRNRDSKKNGKNTVMAKSKLNNAIKNK